MKTDWQRMDEENDRLFEKQMEEGKRRSAADHAFFSAAQYARSSARQSDLLPRRNEDGDFEYELQQGLRAACHGREDVSAVLVIQRSLLLRLDRNYKLLLVAVALLGYIAYRVT